MTDSERPLDVVVWGATGFTGGLTAEYLARHYGIDRGLRWAIGGRSRDKLDRVRERLVRIDPRAGDLPLVVADGDDRPSLDAMVRQTRVVLSTVGPFSRHGRHLVAACVASPTDYCDSTGEPQFIRAMIDAHHARAHETGARIVHCCGFDSVPSDLGTLLVQAHARDEHGARCCEVRHYVSVRGGGFSGGTVASMVGLLEEASRDSSVRAVLADPYALDPDRGERGPDRDGVRGVRWDADLGRWTGPFLMAAINARVVRRSNALLGYAWGKGFRYVEGMSFGAGPRGWLSAAGVSAGTAAAFGVMAVGPVRRALAAKVLPSPGEGPSKEKRDRSSFVSRFLGVLDGTGRLVRGEVRGVGDPGYDETAKMLAESALCLARDHDATRTEGGILTPASCLGMALIARLRKAGMTFEVRADA